MSDNEEALPGMGTPPSSPLASSSNQAGPPGLGTPPSSPIASFTNPAGPAGQQPVVTSGSLSASMQAPAAFTDRQSGSSMSTSLPGMHLPAYPFVGPAQRPYELNTPSPLTSTSNLTSMPHNSTSIHTQPMAGASVASGSAAENNRAGPVRRITRPLPLIWTPPPTSPPPGLSIQTTHVQDQQPVVRPATPELMYVPGLPPGTIMLAPAQRPLTQQHTVQPTIPGSMYIQGSPPGTTNFASTQPQYGSGPAHATASGAPFVTHGLGSPAYVQPPAGSSVPPWQTSNNNPAGSVTSAQMAQSNVYQFPAHPWQYPHATSVRGFPIGGVPQFNAHQYPAPPGMQLNATPTECLPTDSTQQFAARRFSVTPPWRRQDNGEFISGDMPQSNAQPYSAPSPPPPPPPTPSPPPPPPPL